jgi:hypothetical protein
MHLPSKIAAIVAIVVLATACAGPNSSQGAKQGATSGAVGGAVGGLVSSLIFGGDPLGGAAAGAAVGAASGAAVGATTGARVDKQQNQRYIDEFGKDNYNGFLALAGCDYDKALVLAARGQQNPTHNYALSGLWLEAITYADQNNYAKAATLYPMLEQNDPELLDRSDTERKLKDAVRRLRTLRTDQNQPPQCAGT